MDKKDEEELKQWKEENLNYVDTYGVDIFKDDKKEKSAESFILNLNRVIKFVLIIFALLILIFTAFVLGYRWALVHDLVENNVDPLENIYDEWMT